MNRESCRHLLGDFSDYVDGAASDELCAEIERHLSECADCRVLVDTLRKTVSLVHELPRSDMPAEARRRLYKSLDLNDYFPPE